ncbi:MAG: hypothetical protein M1828_006672 [Chrysothrix sp. TS-e1954]|nr:MAG: hypothetical protein M1828_006672 [Chrysothrix sp. TS-e1954]
MLDETYFDTYKRYKAGTRRVFDWLVETTGDEILLSQSLQTGPSSRVRLTTKDLPRLARKATSLLAASASASASMVPPSIRGVLDQIITARRQCAAQHRLKTEHAEKFTSESNKRHDHFIKVLEEVQQILGRSVTEPPEINMRPGHPKQDKASIASLTNRFDFLELQEPPQSLGQDVDSLSCSFRKQTFAKHLAIEYPSINETEEGVFACFCFFWDCHRIRNYIRTLWRDYRQRLTSLTVAALTTNMVFDVIHRLHADLARDFPTYSTYEAMDRTILDGSTQPRFDEVTQKGLRNIPLEWISDPYNFELPMAGREAYSVLRYLANGYAKGISPDFDPRINEFDWATQHKTALGTYAFPQLIKLVLLRALPDVLCFQLAMDNNGFFTDELSSGILGLWNDHNISVPLVVACDVFIDIHFVLLEDMHRPFEDLQEGATYIEMALKKAEIHKKAMKTDPTLEETSYNIAQIKHNLNPIRKDSAKIYRQVEFVPPRGKMTPFYMLKHHPVLCGMLLFNLNRQMCYSGLRAANEWRCLMGLVHVYNAARQEGHLSIEWPDMEHVIDLYGASYLFVGEPPKSRKQYWKRLMLADGLSPSAFSPDSRFKPNYTLQGGAFITTPRPGEAQRSFEVRQPLLTAMRQRYSVRNGKKEHGMVLREVEGIIAKIPKKPSPGKQLTTIKQQAEPHELSPVNLLKAIRHGIEAEETHMCFDFLTFNRRCLELLRRLKIRLNRDFPSTPWTMSPSTNDDLYMMLGQILQQIGFGNDLYMNSLKMAGTMMAELITREGAAEIGRMQKVCCRKT